MHPEYMEVAAYGLLILLAAGALAIAYLAGIK